MRKHVVEGVVALAIIFLTCRIVPAAIWDALAIRLHIHQAAEPETMWAAVWEYARWFLIAGGWGWLLYKLTTREWEQVRWGLFLAFMGLVALFDELARQRRDAMVGEVRVRFEEDHTGTILFLLLLAALSGGGSNVVG